VKQKPFGIARSPIERSGMIRSRLYEILKYSIALSTISEMVDKDIAIIATKIGLT
jgi:hypothetical protein